MNSTLRIDHAIDNDIHTVTLSGELDEASCADLTECLGACRRPGTRVLLDLQHLNFMDGAGLALLERTLAESALEGWTFAVRGPGERYVARARAA